MPTNAPLDPAEVSDMLDDLRSIGNTIRTILNDPDMTLTDAQSGALAQQLTAVSDMEANLATQAANLVFADSDAAFVRIGGATKAASVKLDALQKNLAKISSTIAIGAAVVSLGTSIATGNVGDVLLAATNLASKVSSS